MQARVLLGKAPTVAKPAEPKKLRSMNHAGEHVSQISQLISHAMNTAVESLLGVKTEVMSAQTRTQHKNMTPEMKLRWQLAE